MSMAATTEVEEEEWSTGQTAKAAYLLYRGHEFLEAQWQGNECFFWFQRTQDLLDDVEVFIEEASLVEPIKFNAAFGKIRKAMFDHPDAPRNRQKQERRRRSTS